ncbi:MAG: Gfo/Idh/MocA family oxidoreductase [Clostridia bacterium]|nr:Gfo/Idh/MocA family oxidoreductase [Clostridia bacterium]
MRQYTVAIAGLGGRGLHTYAKYQDKFPQRMKIVAVADIDKEKVEYAGNMYAVPQDMRFDSAESLLAREKLADVLILATQDRQHVAQALVALEKGYDILLEKPISPFLDDCKALRAAVKRTGRFVLVCHVLRYTTFYRTVKKAIDDGKIGDIVSVQAIENVGYWHMAHSFVRGNWRNSDVESPMILQKCCHDFDIYGWLIGKKCIGVSSFGNLRYFRKECAPEGATERCYNCPHRGACVYSAEKIYFDQADIGFRLGNTGWPIDILAENPTEEKINSALKTGPYGRCVFHCDNNVVDHQVCNLLFEDAVTVDFSMCGFTAKNCRQCKIMGTKGEIVADQLQNIVSVQPFGENATIYDINKIADDLSGHGGGDNAMMTEFFAYLDGSSVDVSSTIENSVQSHEIAFASEISRLEGGRFVALDELR